MSPTLHHEFSRIPVTALASCGALLVAAEGPFLRFYRAKDSQYIASKRVFKAQAVHGISVYSEEYDDLTKIVVWGGPLIRALEVRLASGGHEAGLHVNLSEVLKAPDWILDLAPRLSSLEDEGAYQKGTCVAVTAHNALLHITIHRPNPDVGPTSGFIISCLELTSSTRSILYSAHLFWESQNCVLVAAGTAFGEIIYWSWSHDADMGATSHVHRVFLGHEGSVFGVRISKELPSDCCQNLKRIIASCSDDRTIRIWDVSDVDTQGGLAVTTGQISGSDRTQHTGFSNEAIDPQSQSSSKCLAIGWGHMSRVWTVRFLEAPPCEGALGLLSAGEDASSRSWRLSPNTDKGTALSYKLVQQDCAAYHNGKNIWSDTIHNDTFGRQRVFCGAADAKITAYPLTRTSERAQRSRAYEYTVSDIMSLAQISNHSSDAGLSHITHKSSKKAEFFRSYCFLDQHSFLLTTNSGKVLIGTLQVPSALEISRSLSTSTLVDRSEDLSGYSICASETRYGLAFVAGSTGTIYAYSKASGSWSKVGCMDGKIGDMFATHVPRSDSRRVVALLTTLVGQDQAQLVYVDIAADSGPCISRTVAIPMLESSTGTIITSMALATTIESSFLYLGHRRGSVAVYSIHHDRQESGENVALRRVLNNVHGEETVTALTWMPSYTHSPSGHLMSVGRDGCLAVHHVDLHANYAELVHHLALPIGPNIESLYFHQDHLLVHGFSSKKWVLYDVTTEEEIMGIETGGAHRSWAFRPGSTSQSGATLVWTRASSMHISSQTEGNHRVVRPGGHGREIKAVAVSDMASRRLIATGAEDTDIKLFEYAGDELICRRTLRKHTTGIQHLQWSAGGEYLFSSGGCEEFYIWRIRQLASVLHIGVVCEFAYTPESEHADLRIMSFDVTQRGTAYDIAMVFSDSSIKVYRFSPAAAVKWQPLDKGLYFTSCLTQCLFLAPESVLTTGTDGHTAIWSLPSTMEQSHTTLSRPDFSMKWQLPLRIHQSSSKVMASQRVSDHRRIVISGGDDGSVALLLFDSTQVTLTPETIYAAAPVLLNRAHASAVTACAIIQHEQRIFILTSGNDQWVRLWEVMVHHKDGTVITTVPAHGQGMLDVSRLGKIKTNVADVSSVAVVEAGEAHARIIICGVGMEVVRVEWNRSA